MFKTNLKIAWRSLIKDKQFTFLNIIGLSAGLACALLIFLWVNDEISFDKMFANDNRLYEVMELRTGEGQTSVSDETAGLVSGVLIHQVPEIEYACPLAPANWFPKYTLSANDKNIKASGQYAGKDYFNIFSIKLLDGDKNTVLATRNSMVISDALAEKLFGTTSNVIGKAIRFQQDTTFFVSGVFERASYQSSQQFDFVLSFDYLGDVQPWVKTWDNLGPHCFVLLKTGASAGLVNEKIANVIRKNSSDTTRNIFISRFSDIYLQNTFSHGAQVGSKIAYVKMFSLIAVFILIIACINFMNLSTAKATRRMKEIGIKKVVGAERKQLVFQFLSESILLTVFAATVAIAICIGLLPSFNRITGKQIGLHASVGSILSFIGIILLTGLLVGSSPGRDF